MNDIIEEKKNIKTIFNYDDVKIATLEYFKGDELATSTWINKYALKDDKGNFYEKTPVDMHKRLAKEFARIEKNFPNSISEEIIFELFDKFKYIIPQGSPMAGIGNNFQYVSLSNCFVIGNNIDSDSYGGILKLDQELVQLMKRRAGVGIDLSFIRPSGSPVKNSALTSTGVVPFMERYSNSTREVAQDGRRGALMESISIVHPDSEDFIDAKMDEKKVTGANISVRITDDFMKAALNNNKFIQQYPIDSLMPKYVKEIDANNLWKKIIHNAWQRAEPGILFWDTIINESIPDSYSDEGFKTVSTNPCFPASEYLLTKTGYVKIGMLYDLGCENVILADNRISYVENGIEKPDNWIININKTGVIERNASNIFLTKVIADIIEIKTRRGYKLRCTPDHHIATTNGMIEAQYLTPDHNILIALPDIKDSILNLNPETKFEILALLIGLVTGDGTFSKNGRVHIDLWGADKNRMKIVVCELIDKLHKIIGDLHNSKNRIYSKYMISEINDSDKIRITSKWLGEVFKEYDFIRESKHIVPEFILNNSSTTIGKFYIAAIMYCDGSVQGSTKSGFTIRLSQSNLELLEKIQLILQSNGMSFSIYKRRDSKYKLLPDGKGGNKEYQCKTQYELISSDGSIVKYKEFIGFLGDLNKENKLNIDHNFKIKTNIYDSLVEINKLKSEPVFCIKEDIGRNIIVNGVSVRRCGEITLCPNDSCRLLVLNLYSYVNKPFTKKAKFDNELFKEHVGIAQKLMDDLIELELEKIDKILEKINNDPEEEETKRVEINLWKAIKEKCKKGRRTGLGVTGEGDMLAALGITYGTDEANDFSEKIHKTLKLEAYRSSVTMAKERGAFPIYSSEKEKDNPFLNRIKDEDPELYSDMVNYGRRNIALLTIAPTGSVSILTQTTSGIEPAFLISYMRRKKINPNDKSTRIDFVDSVGDSWQEYPVFHHKFLTYLENNNYNVNDIINLKKEEIDKIISESPYHKATSNDVDWVKKVEMQGRIQKHVDHSISVTVNLPNNVSEDIVSNVYETGWKSGCKGITVYRDGSRSGVLISNDKKNESKINKTNAPKRLKTLECDIHHLIAEGDPWIVLIGLLDNDPYEVFAFKKKNIKLSNKIKKGKLTKIKQGRYDLELDDFSLEDIKSHFESAEEEALTRMVSTALRHGADIKFIYEQLLKSEGNIVSFSKAIGRTLKKYISDEIENINEQINPECEDNNKCNIVREDGCKRCLECGFSACN